MRVGFVAFVVAVGILGANPTSAQDKAGANWYGQVSLGALMPHDTDYSANGDTATIQYSTGFSLHGTIGYRWASGIRAEGELAYGRTELDGASVNGTPVGLSGDIDLLSATVGGFYDFVRGETFSPYAGVGAGFIQAKSDRVTATANGRSVTVDGDSETSFTAFAEIGVGVRIAPGTELVPAYRYQWINDGSSGFDDSKASTFKIGLRFGL